MTRTALAALVALGTLAAAVPPAQAVEPYSESPSQSHAVRSGGGYDVFVGGVKRATFNVSDPAYTVRSTSSADGSESAVISDFDGTVGKLKGRAPQLLGFTTDGTGLLAVQHPDAADDSTYVGSLVRFDLASGAAKPLLSSDSTSLYRDFKLVDVRGRGTSASSSTTRSTAAVARNRSTWDWPPTRPRGWSTVCRSTTP